MFNNQIADTILEKYGKDALIIYCKIQSMINNKIDSELSSVQGYEPSDYNYDAQWWDKKYQELINN